MHRDSNICWNAKSSPLESGGISIAPDVCSSMRQNLVWSIAHLASRSPPVWSTRFFPSLTPVTVCLTLPGWWNIIITFWSNISAPGEQRLIFSFASERQCVKLPLLSLNGLRKKNLMCLNQDIFPLPKQTTSDFTLWRARKVRIRSLNNIHHIPWGLGYLLDT